jgi:Flp pilus assembly protein TadD
MIPGETRELSAPAPAARRPERSHDAAEAERIAQQYEREVRARLSSVPEPPPSFVDRHRRLFVVSAIALALGAAAAVYTIVDRRNAETLAKGAAGRGRAGLARDTLGSLREAHRLLSEARRRAKTDPEIASLAAQVASVLAVEHGDEQARAVAKALADDPRAGDGAVAARWLLAGSAEEREQAEADVLAAGPSSPPLLQALAARILLARGEGEDARGRLELAAHSNPPLLRALSDLGDLALGDGDAPGALAFYGAALAAQPTHPRSAVGAAEARLALGKDLDVAARELAAVEADEASAPPRDLRVRFEVAFARTLAGAGDHAAGAARLARASESHGESASLAAALAEIELAARAWDKAEAAAARAVRLEPREISHRVLLARSRIGLGRFAEALAATRGHEGRAIRVQRAIARYRLGQYREARAELEQTAHKGRMPADAAVWYALVDVATGRAARALPLLERLASAASPPPLAQVALGRAYEGVGRLDDAEQAYRSAMEREPSEPAPAAALGALLLARGRAADAIPVLARAIELDGADLAARRALGEARLAEGQPSAAREDLDVVLLAAPTDAAALRLLSAAWLAEKEPAEARRAAERAVSAAPRDAAARLAAARAALAAGDRAAAKAHAERALKLGAKGDAAAEAKRIKASSASRSR